MIFDDIINEVTSRDMYMFYRGELKEYFRNHPDLDEASKKQLSAWVQTGLGKSIHSNPWYLWKDQGGMFDYLDALKIVETRRKK